MPVKGNSSKNSVSTRLPRYQSGQLHFDQRSRDRSVDTESFVPYLKPYVALRRLSIKQSLGQDVPRSSGESGGSSGA